MIIAINLKTFTLSTLVSLSSSIYNSVAVSSYTTSFDQQRQAIIVVGPHLLVNSSDTFGPSVERVVAIGLAPPHKVEFVADIMYQCNPQGFPGYPPNNCSQGTYDSPFLGSGSVLPISSANSTRGSVYAVLVAEQGWVPPSPTKPSKQQMRLVGFEIPKSTDTATTIDGHLRHPPGAATTLFNHSIDIGFWALANDRNGGLIGLGPCCDPAMAPSCPALCAGTTPETPRMILSAWPSAELSDPQGKALILGVFDIDDMGLGFSDGCGDIDVGWGVEICCVFM